MTIKQLNWKFAEEFVTERPDIVAVRQHALELGVEAVSPAMGAQIAVIAAAIAVAQDNSNSTAPSTPRRPPGRRWRTCSPLSGSSGSAD